MSHWSYHLAEFNGTEIEEIESADIGWDYEFNVEAIVKNSAGYHVVSSAGCSCPSHEEMASYCSGPHGSYKEALKYISESHRSGFRDEE